MAWAVNAMDRIGCVMESMGGVCVVQGALEVAVS